MEQERHGRGEDGGRGAPRAVDSSTARDASHLDTQMSAAASNPVTRAAFLPRSDSFSGLASVARLASSVSSVGLDDALPRPHSQPRTDAADVAPERRSLADSPAQGLGASSNIGRTQPTTAAASDGDDDEQMRRRLLTASALSTPVSGEAVSARLLQALPQLSLGQLLQEFNNQTPPWRGFASARHDSTENAARDSAVISDGIQPEETSGLLLASSREQSRSSSPPRSRRRGSSGASLYSMGAAGDFERSDSTTSPLQAMEDGTAGPAGALPAAQSPDPSRPRRNTEEESDDQTAMDELQALFRRCHNSLPFVALFLIYFAYQHATGILVLVVGTVAVMGLDQRMRSQIALKDQASTWHLLCIVGMCAIDMVALCSVDGDPNPLRHFAKILQTNAAHSSDNSGGVLGTGGIFWQVLWTVLVNDFLVRLWSIVAKAVVAGIKSERLLCDSKPGQNPVTTSTDLAPASPILSEDDGGNTSPRVAPSGTFYRRKRKLYGLIEMSSIFLRSLLAGIPWCSFYQLCASKFMADVFTFAYLFVKGLILATQGRRIYALARSFVTLGLEFGAYVPHDELMEAGSPDCSICYEAMRQPVKLPCSHMFCEECVTEWFDRERSCPLCRASVGPSSLTADDGIKPQYLDGRTSLVPQLL